MNAKIDSHFPQLPPAVRDALTAELSTVTLEPGEFLFKQATPGNALYVLQKGSLTITRTETDGTQTSLNNITESGTVVGEMALISGRPRNATVQANEASELHRLSKTSFDHLVELYPTLLDTFTEWFVARFQQGNIGSKLNKLFGDLDAAALNAIEAKFEWLILDSGDVLFNQGEPGNSMYIVASGRLQIMRTKADGSIQVLGEVRAGEMIGEFALLTTETRNSTVYATRDSVVAELSEPMFAKLVDDYPQVMMGITREIIRRNQHLAAKQATSQDNDDLGFVLIPTGSNDIVDRIAPQLVDILSHFDETLYLDSRRFDELFGKDGAAQTPFDAITNITIIDFLNQLERKYKYIFYKIDPEWTNWTERCVRFSDRIILIAEAGSDPTPSRLETRIRQQFEKAHVQLVLFHEDTVEQPQGTSSWLDNRELSFHHHVRFNNQSDWQRLGRLLVGKGIGLVLSGGGTRSLNQLGAFRALEEANIPVDVIGGVSMGSLTAACYATEKSPEETYRLFASRSSSRDLLDFTLPITSIVTSKKVTSLFKEAASGLDIEDTWRPFFCLSTNVTKAQLVVHRRGPLWRAMRASMSVPSLFVPVTNEDGDLLADGGMLNNLPIDIMASLLEVNFIIAINNKQPKGEKYNFEPELSGWKILWRRLNPFAEEIAVPDIANFHMRSVASNYRHHYQRVFHLADILVTSPVEDFGILDFSIIDQVMQIGYEATKNKLDVWRETGGQLPSGVVF